MKAEKLTVMVELIAIIMDVTIIRQKDRAVYPMKEDKGGGKIG